MQVSIDVATQTYYNGYMEDIMSNTFENLKDYNLIKTALDTMTKLIQQNEDNAKYFNTNIQVELNNFLERRERKVRYANQVIEIAKLINMHNKMEAAQSIANTDANTRLFEQIMRISTDALEVYEKALDTIEFDKDVCAFNQYVSHFHIELKDNNISCRTYSNDNVAKLEKTDIKYYAKEEFCPIR